jgi:hypothetical protein
MLIKRGADQNVRDQGGRTVLDLAATSSVRRTLAARR